MDSVELEANAERKRKRHMIDESSGDVEATASTMATKNTAHKLVDGLETERSEATDRMRRREERRRHGRELMDALTIGGETTPTPAGPNFGP